MKKARGITLVALVVTIIVMLILAGVSLNTIGGDNGLIARAFDAQLIAKFSGYNEELVMNCFDDIEVCAVKTKMKDYVPSLEDEYLDKFVIVKSKLLYIGTDKREIEIANRLGMGGGSEASDAEATVKEIQAIVDGVVALKDKYGDQLPTNDTDKLNTAENANSNNGIIGTRLFDRSSLNLANGRWNILVEYNNANKETARYGTGCYWLKKNNNYTIGEETLNFKNDYIINYANKEFVVLSGRAVNWNVNETLGVSGAVLNLDPMSLANGEWVDKNFIDQKTGEKYDDFITENSDGSETNTGIRKTGDVKYDEITKSLSFNESEENASGEGGKIALVDTIADLSNGFTFEFYGNMSREFYKSSKQPNGPSRLGFFCQTNSLNLGNPKVGIRFFLGDGGNILDIPSSLSWDPYSDDYKLIYHPDRSHVYIEKFHEFSDYGFSMGKDFYLTVSFVTVDSNDEVMRSGDWARVDYYINGEKLGYCYHGKSDFASHMKEYYTDKYYFVIGGSIIFDPIDMYYYKGKCYGCRLYEKGLTSDQVKLNYDKTLKYRDSFKDE